MKLYGVLFSLFLFLCVGLVQAQTFLDGPGATSALIFQFKPEDQASPAVKQNGDVKDKPPHKAGELAVNHADGSVKVSYVWEDKWQEDEDWNMRFGFDVRGKVTNGYLRLFDSEKIAPELGGNFFVGLNTDNFEEKSTDRSSSSPIVDHAVLLGIGYRHSEYKLLALDPGSTPSHKALNSPLVGAYYNLHLRNQSTDSDDFALDILFGFSIGYAWEDNNYRDLDTYEVTETKNVEVSNGQDMPVVQRKVTALMGKNQEFDALKFSLDLLLGPSMFGEKFGMKFFVNYTRRDDGTQFVEPGGGIFFPASQENETEDSGSTPNFLSKIDKAIIFQYDTRTDIEEKAKLGFVGAYRF